jgi:chromosome segregation ATPase
MPQSHWAHSRRLPADAGDLDRAIAALEATVEPLFAARRYREFFAEVHALRERLRTVRLPHDDRSRLWQRLNRCTEAAKARQAQEFAARDAANLARWRDQLADAQAYADALRREIAELRARGGTTADVARWQGRIAEKETRLARVDANLADLRRKIAAVSSRQPATGGCAEPFPAAGSPPPEE